MRTRVHPLSRATYDVRPDGLLDVTEHGVSGVFDALGRWVSASCGTAIPSWPDGWPDRSCPRVCPATRRTSRRHPPRRQRSDERHARRHHARRAVSAVARRRSTPRTCGAAVAVADGGWATHGSRRSIHVARVPSARGREGVEEGLADGLPRRGHPARRRSRPVRDRRHPGPGRPVGPRPDPGVPQHLSAPRSAVEGVPRSGRGASLPVPRHRLEPRRVAEARAVQVGLPADPRRVAAARRARRHLGRVRLHQPRPGLRVAGRLPR